MAHSPTGNTLNIVNEFNGNIFFSAAGKPLTPSLLVLKIKAIMTTTTVSLLSYALRLKLRQEKASLFHNYRLTQLLKPDCLGLLF